MKNEVLIILLAVVLILFSLPVEAVFYCPGGNCADRDPSGEYCVEDETRQCTGSLYYGSNTGCQLSSSRCNYNIWSDCTGWKNSYYESVETKCDFIDNDCDGLVDEANVCTASEICFNSVDDNVNGQIDCQDATCLYNFAARNQACITLEDVDADDSLRIDGFDLSIVGGANGTSPGDAAWDARADFNDDLVVNDIDMDWLDANFGSTVPNSFTCANRPSNVYTGWIAPGNASGKAHVSAKLNIGSTGYGIDFFPKTGHNYTTMDLTSTGTCCERNYRGDCSQYALNEVYALYDVLPGGIFRQIALHEKLGICFDPVQKGIVQSTWDYQITTYGQSDCSQLNCVSKGYRWQDLNAQCSYLSDDFNKGQPGGSYILLQGNEASNWIFGNSLFIRNETFTINCIALNGALTCGTGFPGLDTIVLNRYPYSNQLQGNILGLNQSCTYGDQASCDETTTTVLGSTTTTTTPGSTTTTTTQTTTTTVSPGDGGGFGVCGDGVVNTGEQCEDPGDCIPLGMNDCDMTGLITGFECRCYSTLENQGTETILFTTSCQDVGNGQQGLRTETTRIIDSATGNVLSETSQQVTCSLPPVNVPGFNIINLLLVSSILLIYYAYKKK